MTDLECITSTSSEEEIEDELEEIGLPGFDIIVHEDDDWFSDMMDEQNAAIEKIKRDNNLQ